MKAVKHTLTVKVEVLSVDSIPAMLMKVMEQVSEEYTAGELTADDGDSVSWEIESEGVEF